MGSKQVSSGLDSPLRLSCQPCHHAWDAVVYMETFDRQAACQPHCTLNEHMSQLLLLGKFEYGGGSIFKVVLEC